MREKVWVVKRWWVWGVRAQVMIIMSEWERRVWKGVWVAERRVAGRGFGVGLE